MINQINDLFQQTSLFLLKLLGHLIIHTLILLFVSVGVHLHRMFIEHTIDAEKPAVATATKKLPLVVKSSAPRRTRSKKHKRVKRINSRGKQMHIGAPANTSGNIRGIYY
jgi:hypothetical protein